MAPSAPTGQTGAQLDIPTRSTSRASSESRWSSPHAANGVPYEDESDADEDNAEVTTSTTAEYPDATQTNRRPPRFKERPAEINTKYDTKLFAICGEYVCTTGYITRVWSLKNGEVQLNLNHPETTKVTAMAFKAAGAVEDEGKRIWLGTNTGEIHEIDIPSGEVVRTRSNAHTRREIIKIYRCGREMWSLDEDGKLHLWIGDRDRDVDLSYMPHPLRLPKGHSFSIVVDKKLWLAIGKEVRVIQPSVANSQVLQVTLSQTGTGEITSGATISGHSERIYFGHADGKVTIYSRNDYSCLGVINVSLYKISSLLGVGDYLWAGYNTGMIYVYDTSVQPWKVMKDWKAHDHPIAGVVVDRSWKLERLQVASLGTDNMIRIWDGLLEDDWLGALRYFFAWLVS